MVKEAVQIPMKYVLVMVAVVKVLNVGGMKIESISSEWNFPILNDFISTLFEISRSQLLNMRGK